MLKSSGRENGDKDRFRGFARATKVVTCIDLPDCLFACKCTSGYTAASVPTLSMIYTRPLFDVVKNECCWPHPVQSRFGGVVEEELFLKATFEDW